MYSLEVKSWTLLSSFYSRFSGLRIDSNLFFRVFSKTRVMNFTFNTTTKHKHHNTVWDQVYQLTNTSTIKRITWDFYMKHLLIYLKRLYELLNNLACDQTGSDIWYIDVRKKRKEKKRQENISVTYGRGRKKTNWCFHPAVLRAPSTYSLAFRFSSISLDTLFIMLWL